MILEFKNNEQEYLKWVQAHQFGYVVNVDEPNHFPQYPMVHIAKHKLISSPKRTNYTTGKYFKVCSLDLDELEQWCINKYGRGLTKCRSCM